MLRASPCCPDPIVRHLALLGACSEQETAQAPSHPSRGVTVDANTCHDHQLPYCTKASVEVRRRSTASFSKLSEAGGHGVSMYQIDERYEAALRAPSHLVPLYSAERYAVLVKDRAVSQQAYDEAGSQVAGRAALERARIDRATAVGAIAG